MSRFDNKAAGLLSKAELKHTRYKLVYWLCLAFMVFLALMVIIPSIWAVMAGFKTTQEIYEVPARFFPKNFSLSRIGVAWNELQMGRSMINSVYIMVGDIVFNVVVSGLAGYVISRVKPIGVKFLFTVITWTMMMPGEMRMVPLYMEFVKFPIGGFSMMNTFWPMWLMAASNCFNILLFKNCFDGISISYVESARLDGCTDIGIFARVIVPLSVPIITYVAITTAAGAWSGYLWPLLVLTDLDLQPVPLLLYRANMDSTIKMNDYLMGLTIACVPSLLVFIIFEKRIMGGVNVGGVKG